MELNFKYADFEITVKADADKMQDAMKKLAPYLELLKQYISNRNQEN